MNKCLRMSVITLRHKGVKAYVFSWACFPCCYLTDPFWVEPIFKVWTLPRILESLTLHFVLSGLIWVAHIFKNIVTIDKNMGKEILP